MITVNLRYKGAKARAFAGEMMTSGTVDLIRAEAGDLRYRAHRGVCVRRVRIGI